MKHIPLQTERPEEQPMPEQKFAIAIIARAVQDMERLDNLLKLDIKARYNAHQKLIVIEGWDAAAFFFARRNRIRSLWLHATGFNLDRLRETLYDRYPWIAEKYNRKGGIARWQTN